MVIVVATTVVWIALAAFCLVPKKLSPFDMIFLFFVDTIFELGTYSLLHVNLKLIQVTPGVDNGVADLMFRLIELPLLLVVTSNLLLHSNISVKWGGVAAIIVFSLAVQKFLVSLDILVFHHWHLLYSGIYLCAYIAFSRAMTWVIMRRSTQGAL